MRIKDVPQRGAFRSPSHHQEFRTRPCRSRSNTGMFSRLFAEPLFGPMPSELSIELWRAFFTYLIPSKVMMPLYFTQSIIITSSSKLHTYSHYQLHLALSGRLAIENSSRSTNFHSSFLSTPQCGERRVWAPRRAGRRPRHVGFGNCLGLMFRIPGRGMNLSLTSLNGFILSFLNNCNFFSLYK